MVATFITKIALLVLSSQLGAEAVIKTGELMRHEPRRQERTDGKSFMTDAQVPVYPLPAGVNDWCDDDFPLGTHMTNDCADPSNERALDRAECEQAMIAAGGVFQDNDTHFFDIPDSFYNRYPAGCFRIDNDDGSCGTTNKCYYFNECAGSQCAQHNSTSITGGTPVCYREKVKYGTTNTSTCDAAGYDNIKDENLCHVLTSCMSHCAGNPFAARMLNASKYHIYPKWCFISLLDGCAYFNEPLIPDDGSVTFPMPSNPKGRPVCNVTYVGGGPTDPSAEVQPIPTL